MPIYESVCLKCNARHEYVSTVANYLDTPLCCGESSQKKILSAPSSIGEIPVYESPASGKMISSRDQRREDFKRTGTRAWEGMRDEKIESERQKRYADEKFDAALDKTVRTAWAQLPPSKKAAVLATK